MIFKAMSRLVIDNVLRLIMRYRCLVSFIVYSKTKRLRLLRRAYSRSLHNRAKSQSFHSKYAKHIQYCAAYNKLNIKRLLEQSHF